MFGYNVEEFGGPDVMIWQELPDPEPGPGQVLVDVKATGINFAETRMRAGTYSGQPLPFVMGMEGAGTVRAIGDGVDGFAVGDRVFGRARGCHAEQVVLTGRSLIVKCPSESTVSASRPVGNTARRRWFSRVLSTVRSTDTSGEPAVTEIAATTGTSNTNRASRVALRFVAETTETLPSALTAVVSERSGSTE